ncbi:MAG: DNA polymerase III subunit delta [Tannerella sp.]|jgi:DNA polymerase-3 subunit delta'|nr:DNA polymerase III subunit delta [Tannerella sp.]
MFFRDVTGQDKLKRQLIRLAQEGFIPHARLFCGPAGYGAFPLALAYARYLNCRERTDTDSCGHCPSCLKYNALAHPDLHFAFPMAKTDREKDEDVCCDNRLSEWRDFLKTRTYFDFSEWQNYLNTNKRAVIYANEGNVLFHKVSMKIYEADYRVLFIWIPERMKDECANKLLKIIEEPPKNTLIFMVSEEPDNILGTVLSRLQRTNLTPVETDALARVAEEKFGVDPSQSQQFAHIAQGDCLKLADVIQTGEENKLFLELFMNVMRNAWTRNVKDMKALTEKVDRFGRDKQIRFLRYCQRLIRENFMYRFHAEEINYMNREEAAFSANFAEYINEMNVFEFISELTEAERHIAQNVNSKMVFFDLSLHITVLIRKKGQ